MTWSIINIQNNNYSSIFWVNSCIFTKTKHYKKKKYINHLYFFFFQKHGFISFSDAISRLDLKGAAQDIRRVNYVTKVMVIDIFFTFKFIPHVSWYSEFGTRVAKSRIKHYPQFIVATDTFIRSNVSHSIIHHEFYFCHASVGNLHYWNLRMKSYVYALVTNNLNKQYSFYLNWPWLVSLTSGLLTSVANSGLSLGCRHWGVLLLSEVLSCNKICCNFAVAKIHSV